MGDPATHRSLQTVLKRIGLTMFCWAAVFSASAAERPRLAVLTDIGGDPDDQRSLTPGTKADRPCTCFCDQRSWLGKERRMSSLSATPTRLPASSAWPLDAALAVSLWMLGLGSLAAAEPGSAPRDFSGWRGGIGITFGTPSRDIADVTEMGYEIVWGGEDPRAVKTLGVSVFRYWNSIVETSLKGAGYDFSQMADKDEAAKLAFDAWMERAYGVKGLSQYAQVRYNPQGAYGDVAGSMDLSSENDLVKAVIAKYLQGFDKDGITHGGIGLDNAGRVPREFLETLTRRLNARGLGIAANGCPDQYLPYIDFFGNEGFPFSINYARQAREKGLRGILGEFTMQHLSGGELEAYLKNKLFNGIVFFGYTNGGTAAGAHYSSYCSRPDVYHHQRWVLRKLVPISRAVQRAGRQLEPAAKLAPAVASADTDGVAENAHGQRKADTGPRSAPAGQPAGVAVDVEGRVQEAKRREAGLARITGRSPGTAPVIIRFGGDVASGIYLFVDSGRPEEVICDAQKLSLHGDTLVFDEFAGQVLEARRAAGTLTFKTVEGPSVVQLGSAATVAKNLLARVADGLRWQLTQRALDRELGIRFPRKAWSRFCQAAKWDTTVARTGKSSLGVVGGTYTATMPQWKYFNRQGAAQFVSLNQTAPQPVVLRAFSRAREVDASEEVVLETPGARRRHFDAREGHTYGMHLYLDYQDGQWPEVHTASFSPGTHDWEEKSIRVEPTRPVKTALVLLEFHQPQGAAWFDDLSLTDGNGTDRNLLAAPGFEDADPTAALAQAIGAEYEQQVQALLEALEAAAKSATPADVLPALGKQVDALTAAVTAKGLSSCFPRELRDLDDARDKLEPCRRLLAGPR
jgi:hypothetical protein